MHKFIVALTAAALLAAPAFALEKRSKRTENSRLTEDTKKKDAAAEKSHKDALLHSKQMWDVLGGPRAEKPDHGYRWRLRADLIDAPTTCALSIESTFRYLGFEVDDTIAIVEQIDV